MSSKNPSRVILKYVNSIQLVFRVKGVFFSLTVTILNDENMPGTDNFATGNSSFAILALGASIVSSVGGTMR